MAMMAVMKIVEIVKAHGEIRFELWLVCGWCVNRDEKRRNEV